MAGYCANNNADSVTLLVGTENSISPKCQQILDTNTTCKSIRLQKVSIIINGKKQTMACRHKSTCPADNKGQVQKPTNGLHVHTYICVCMKVRAHPSVGGWAHKQPKLKMTHCADRQNVDAPAGSLVVILAGSCG